MIFFLVLRMGKQLSYTKFESPLLFHANLQAKTAVISKFVADDANTSFKLRKCHLYSENKNFSV